jgi:IS30 family transposase
MVVSLGWSFSLGLVIQCSTFSHRRTSERIRDALQKASREWHARLCTFGRSRPFEIEAIEVAAIRLAQPEQIAGWLKRVHPEDERFYVSHETIYRSLFVQARGVLKKELLYHLRSKRTIRRSKQAGLISDGRGQIKDIVSTRQRPAAVEDRAVPGQWEGDLLSGSKNSYIATLESGASAQRTAAGDLAI